MRGAFLSWFHNMHAQSKLCMTSVVEYTAGYTRATFDSLNPAKNPLKTVVSRGFIPSFLSESN